MELIYLRPLSDTFVLFWLVLSGKTASSTLSDVSAVASSGNRDVLGGGALCICMCFLAKCYVLALIAA